jgi:hypothetical protein
MMYSGSGSSLRINPPCSSSILVIGYTPIPLSLLIVLPVVSSAVFLSMGHSLIAVGFVSNFQLLSRGFSFRHDGGRRPLEEGEGEEGEEAGKHVLLIKLQT